MKAQTDSAVAALSSSDAEQTFGTVTAVTPVEPPAQISAEDVSLRQYTGERDLPHVMRLIDNELSEPYSIFTYRYFLHTWPKLCFLAFHKQHCFGTVVCKLEPHQELMRGYIAMLVVEKSFRGLGIGTKLVKVAVDTMMQGGDLDEVVLEAEVSNLGALSLYTNLGFIRDKRLARYYMNGVDAFRLKLLLPLSPEKEEELAAAQLHRVQVSLWHMYFVN
ncbi:hypothetical protein WJX73_001730 [Symbiochloris irregularis]|uniref:N-acetyltransferase domain-containing protein n=1 Tax=Symbiochloris irregularis TaxID=706552 RepID=A0AAW1P8Y7_9CHLO